jgi:DNA-binding NarL/FixJ family response regulator
LIRVWIETASAVVRAGFESMLGREENIVVAADHEQADVVLSDAIPDEPERLPAVILSDGPFTARLYQLGVRAVLPQGASATQLAAALAAAIAGLVAMPASSSGLAFQAANIERDIESLTPRETEALEMLAEGMSNKQIAAALNISEHTAKFHVNSILSKLGAATRTEAVMRGIRLGILKV